MLLSCGSDRRPSWPALISRPRNPLICTTVGSLLPRPTSTGVVMASSSLREATADHGRPRPYSQESGLHNRSRVRNSAVMRTYGQYCPIARGAEIFAERWTPLIVRNLHLGCGNFSEILEGAPGLSRVRCSHSGSSSSNGSVWSSRQQSSTGAGTTTNSRLRATISSRSASRSASGARVGSRSPPSALIPLWPCGRCATRSAETGSRIDASSSVSTSPAGRAVSAIGYSSSWRHRDL